MIWTQNPVYQYTQREKIALDKKFSNPADVMHPHMKLLHQSQMPQDAQPLVSHGKISREQQLQAVIESKRK